MKSNKYIVSILFIVLILAAKAFAQNEGVQLGSSLNQLRQAPQGGFFDYSDPQAVNIKVAVWGWVKYPGRYVIPSYSSINDLISYAGGPTDAARMENIRLMRLNKDSSQS
ncbi:MAG: SLBB domain-containing protein, partial [Ignavibacteriaceae bacterium]|nr:SLBB domain-containing protein [Ignavibacteriaceae bacterium]